MVWNLNFTIIKWINLHMDQCTNLSIHEKKNSKPRVSKNLYHGSLEKILIYSPLEAHGNSHILRLFFLFSI